MESNLSKTKPALRTKGAVTGNFGAGKRVAGSKLQDIPANNRESLGNFPTKEEYRERLKAAFRRTTNAQLQDFILGELAQMDRQEKPSQWRNPEGAYCSLENYRITAAQ